MSAVHQEAQHKSQAHGDARPTVHTSAGSLANNTPWLRPMPHIWSPDDEAQCSPNPVGWTVHHTIWSFQSSSGITLYAYRGLQLPESLTRNVTENNGEAKSKECKGDIFRNL